MVIQKSFVDLAHLKWNYLAVDGLLPSGRLPASKQKSPVTSETGMRQLLKTLLGGIYDSRVNFDNVVFDDLGIWMPDRVCGVIWTVLTFVN